MCSVVSQICILQLKKYICDYRDTHAQQNGFRHGRTFTINLLVAAGYQVLPVQQALVCRIYLGLFTCPFSNYISPLQQQKGSNQRRQGTSRSATNVWNPFSSPLSVVYASEKFIVKCFTIWKLWDFAIVSPEQIKVQYNEGLPVCLCE